MYCHFPENNSRIPVLTTNWHRTLWCDLYLKSHYKYFVVLQVGHQLPRLTLNLEVVLLCFSTLFSRLFPTKLPESFCSLITWNYLISSPNIFTKTSLELWLAASSSPEECHSLRSLHQCATQLQSIHKGTIQLIIIPQWPAFAPRFALTMTTDYDWAAVEVAEDWNNFVHQNVKIRFAIQSQSSSSSLSMD